MKKKNIKISVLYKGHEKNIQLCNGSNVTRFSFFEITTALSAVFPLKNYSFSIVPINLTIILVLHVKALFLESNKKRILSNFFPKKKRRFTKDKC